MDFQWQVGPALCLEFTVAYRANTDRVDDPAPSAHSSGSKNEAGQPENRVHNSKNKLTDLIQTVQLFHHQLRDHYYKIVGLELLKKEAKSCLHFTVV